MKLTWMLLLVVIMHASATSFGQRITITGKKVDLSRLLKEFERKSGYTVFYAQGLLPRQATVDAHYVQADALHVLRDVLTPFELDFKRKDRSLVLIRKIKVAQLNPITTDWLTPVVQQQPITGVVKGAGGVALSNVTVKIKNSDLQTRTDDQGQFSLQVNQFPAILEISFLGYDRKEIIVQKGGPIDIVLTEKVTDVDEVVVIGYGEVKKKDLTGSVVNVKMSDIRDAPVLSADLALQGRVPGADIMASSGEPGAATSIRIRGTRSITATNEPLIVVDGVLDGVTNLADINIADIESISVLKDASATAIYGSRGSNGVIIVTTKQGKAGKDNITWRSTFGLSQLPRKLDIMNASQFAQYRNDFALFTTSDPYGNITENSPMSDYPFPDPSALGKGTDWVDEITRIAPYHTHNLSLSGGSSRSTYYASVAYDNTQGIIQESGLGRFTGRLNLDYKLFPWMKVGIKTNYTKRDEDQNLVAIGGTTWWSGAIYLNPLIKVYDNFNDLWYSGQKFNSPRSILDLDVIRNVKRDGITNTGYIEVEPIKNLKVNSQLTYYYYGQHTYRYDPGNMPAKAENEGGTAYRGEFTEENLMSQTTVNYQKKWDDIHSLDFTAGFIGQKVSSNNFTLQGEGYQSDAILWNNMNAIPDKENYVAGTGNESKTSMSYLARANYNYKSKYYLTVTGRRDGASNFAPNKKWAFFPSAALKWTVSNEEFLKDVTWLSDFSIRASGGRTGNDGISSYRSLAALSSSTNGYLFNGSQPVAFYPSRLASEELSWEKTDMYNIATDISLFKGRVNMTLEAYLSYTKDLLLDVQTPTQTGYTTRFANVGKTSNRGVEFSVETRNIEKTDFSWSTTFSVSHNKQRVDDIGHYDYVNVYGAAGNNSYMMYGYVKDYPLNALWGFQYAGTWKSQEEINRNKVTKAYVSASNQQYRLGSARYIDSNHDGVFNEKDLIYLGNADPLIYGGLQNNFRYKKLSLGVFLNYSLGGKIYNISEQWMGNGGNFTNQYTYMLDNWHPIRNPNSDIPRAGSTDNIASNRMVYDASYLRLKSVSIGYTFDMSKITKSKLKDIQLGLAGENLFVWKKYNGFDPDVSSQSSTSTLRRVDIGAYPKPRTIVGSIQIRY
ncbi:SusC/RagA family TonB-linked outer membrane protein [Sphingobacterium psychroaquaticum]|nr:TonB-dependent receptor [Sphingobacterium psychroaquaticum]